jgi:hypothetical protein
MNRRQLVWALILVTVLLLPVTPALARNELPDNGITIWNEDYTLQEGDTVNGDLVVFNGSATLEPNSRVEGSVVIWNGDASVDGTVERELVVTGGSIDLGGDAWVQGDVVCSFNCTIDRASGARVDGTVIEGLSIPGTRFRAFEGVPMEFPTTVVNEGPGWVLRLILRTIRALVSIVVVSIAAGLVALIWPRQTAQVGSTVLEHPGPSFGIGLLTLLAAGALMVALLLTICLPPIVLLALAVAGLFGWAAVGALVGERFLKAVNAPQPTPVWSAALGTLLISLVAAGLGLLPCIGVVGGIAAFVVGCFGLGAVVLTRFGTRQYIPARARASATPAQSTGALEYHETESQVPPESEEPESGSGTDVSEGEM